MKNLSSPPNEEDKILASLRPKEWKEYIGQENVKKNLKIIVQASLQRKEVCCEHILLYGQSGLGKTSLAYLIAKEMGSEIRVVSAPSLQRIGDLAAILTNLSQGDVLFVDEIHRLNKYCEEIIYPVLEDFKLNLVIGKGPMARTIDLDIPKFTFIGATTRMALLSSPLRNRFGATFQLEYYSQKDIEQIIQQSALFLKVKIDPKAIKILASCSRFTPRVANRLLKRARDFAQVEGTGEITEQIAKNTLEALKIDRLGLETGDRKILKTIIEKFNGGPVGIQALAAASLEEEDTILDIYEPYLMQLGFLKRTTRGRIITKSACQHLGCQK
ncbi:MAG: Holliday junction branch migration DNA helicase RuvB [Candidatus Pacebacteria bacterium]|nr:Holliday junction branch migration DNA helicase RuvB [Candidatus Paceibacterota bacterium]